MYIIFIIDHIHHLMNKSKMLIFAYNSDRRMYTYNVFSELNTGVMQYVWAYGIVLNKIQCSISLIYSSLFYSSVRPGL